MFNLGFSELILLMVLMLIFIGPKQLPEIARTIGRVLAEIKNATHDFSSSIKKTTTGLEDQVREYTNIDQNIKKNEVNDEVNDEVNGEKGSQELSQDVTSSQNKAETSPKKNNPKKEKV